MGTVSRKALGGSIHRIREFELEKAFVTCNNIQEDDSIRQKAQGFGEKENQYEIDRWCSVAGNGEAREPGQKRELYSAGGSEFGDRVARRQRREVGEPRVYGGCRGRRSPEAKGVSGSWRCSASVDPTLEDEATLRKMRWR
ncbi:Protein of unknown function [Gryllus bimaculatus]|nr:Protein of unknown function [Gryllus bimaculatus]